MKAFLKVFLTAIVPLLLLSSCTTTFAGTLFVLTFRDILLYIVIAFILALIIASKSENKKMGFWFSFILSLVLTPLAGFIYLLIKISKQI